MIIQFNTDKNIDGNERYSTYFTTLLEDQLTRFSEYITRIEVHISDENGRKDGQNDKRCMIEARLKNRQPVAVVHEADTDDKAVSGAITKLKNTLDTITGRLKNH